MLRFTFGVWLVLGGVFLSGVGLADGPVIPPDTPLKSLLIRHIGAANAAHIKFELRQDAENEWYSISASGGEVTVAASTRVGLARGAYSYLHDTGTYYLGWEGKRLKIPVNFPDFPAQTATAKVAYRAYLNVVAYGYSTPWWDWHRWQQEIDWMAFHGINMPIAMEGQEYVWRKLWREFGLSDAELEAHFSGPAFLPWHRMGNIEAHQGPLPAYWIERKHALQKRILTRIREFGMQPVTPAFAGYVPKAFSKHYPQANIIQTGAWSTGFAGTFWLAPSDPLFQKIGKRFLELYEETYGPTRFHLADAFNEVIPPVISGDKAEDLARYGRLIFETIKAADPDGVWVLQGWQFGHHKDFWTPQSVAAFLGDLPADEVMIHDLGNDRYPVWQSLNAFSGKSWVHGFIHNYGATDALFGDFDFYQAELSKTINNPARGKLVGLGVFTEGIDNNPLVYDYMIDLAWNNAQQDWSTWIERKLLARYGTAPEATMQGWTELKDAIYSEKYWVSRWEEGAGTYLFFKRPTLNIQTFSGHPGNLSRLRRGIELLLKDSQELGSEPLYQYDLIELTRHYVSMRIDAMLVQAVAHYRENDIEKAKKRIARIEGLSQSLDSLLAHQPGRRLADWLHDAAAWGQNAKERQHLIHNARQQITLWGGEDLKDYAAKSWSGMYESFYLQRWKLFFKGMDDARINHEDFDEVLYRKNIAKWEQQWVNKDGTADALVTTEKPLVQVRRLLVESK